MAQMGAGPDSQVAAVVDYLSAGAARSGRCQEVQEPGQHRRPWGQRGRHFPADLLGQDRHPTDDHLRPRRPTRGGQPVAPRRPLHRRRPRTARRGHQRPRCEHPQDNGHRGGQRAPPPPPPAPSRAGRSPGYLDEELSRGNAHANEVADQTLERVREVMGMAYQNDRLGPHNCDGPEITPYSHPRTQGSSSRADTWRGRTTRK